MGFFKKNETLELQDTIGELQAHNESLVKQIQDYQRTISGFVDVKTKYEYEKMALTEKYNKELLQVKQQLEIEKKSVARKVNRELSRIGVPTFVAEEISINNQSLGPGEITEKWMTMPESKEKHEFFAKHEKVISQSIKKK